MRGMHASRFRSILHVLAIVIGTALISGCSAKEVDCTYPDSTAVSPIAAFIAYPEPGETGVPVNFGLLLYYSPGLAPTIRLSSGAVHVATQPEAVPSLLPSPIASPPYVGATLSANAVPTLLPHTVYAVEYQNTVTSGCPMITKTVYSTPTSFTTQ